MPLEKEAVARTAFHFLFTVLVTTRLPFDRTRFGPNDVGSNINNISQHVSAVNAFDLRSG